MAITAFVLSSSAFFLLPAATDPPAADPLPLQRILIPPSRVPAELERVRQGILVQQPRAEFEAAVKEAALARDRNKTPLRLVQTRYWAHLEGTSLVGGGDWTIVSPGGGPRVLPVPSLNLAMSQVKLGAKDAILGDLNGKTLGLFLEGGKEHSVFFDWTLRGGQEAGGLHFDLQIPPCAIASLDLTLPVDASVSVSRSVAMLSGPQKAGDPRLRLWRMRFTGRSAVDLVIRKPDDADPRPPVVTAHVVGTQLLTPARVRADFEVQVEVLHSPIAQLVFDLDPLLEPFEIAVRNLDVKEWKIVKEPIPAPGPARPPGAAMRPTLVIELRQPFQGTLPPLQIHCLARLPTDMPWTSPWLRLRHAALQAETLKLQVHPDVRLENWQPGDFRLMGITTATDGSQTLTLGGSGTGAQAAPPGRPMARVRTQGVDFLARQRTWWQIGPQSSSLTAEIAYEVSRGSLIELPLALPPGWQVDEVTVQPRELLRNWVPALAGDRAILVVELQRALTPRQEARLTVKLHSAQGRAVPRGGQTFDFPELAPVDPCVREGTLAISVDPLFEATVLRASVPASAPDATGPWRPTVPTFSFNSRNQPVAGALQLRPRPPIFHAVCHSEFILAPGSADVSVRLELEMQTGAPDSIDVQLSAPVPEGWEWKCVSRPDLLRRVQRLPSWDAARYVLALGQHQGLAAAIVLATPGLGERWRLTFNHPLGPRETFSLQGTLKQAGQRSGSSGKEFTAWQWHLPLVTVPAAVSMDGEVRLHLTGVEFMDVTAARLRARAQTALGNGSSAAAAAHSYRYGNVISLGSFPLLHVRDRATPPDRMAQEACDRAWLVTHVEPGGLLVHCFSFDVWNWRQRVVPVRLPAGACLLAARVDARWVERLSRAEMAGAVEVGLPVTTGEGLHHLEMVYTTPLDWPIWAPGAALDPAMPQLPVPAGSFRRTWRLPPGVAPLTEAGLRRLPDSPQDVDSGAWWGPARAVWRSGNGWLSDLVGLPSQEEWMVRQRQALETAETALRQAPHAGQSRSLESALERLVASLNREPIALVVDASALQRVGLSRQVTFVMPSAGHLGGPWHPFWEGLGLVYVPSRSGALLTTRRQWETWQKTASAEPLSPALEEAIREASTMGHDRSDRFRSALHWVERGPSPIYVDAPSLVTTAQPIHLWVARAEVLPSPGAANTEASEYLSPGHPALAAALSDECDDSDGLLWTEWEPIAGHDTGQSLVIVRRDAVRTLGWLGAGFLGLLAWRSRRSLHSRWRFRLLLVWLASAGLAVLWLPPSLRVGAWGPALTGLAVALLWYGRLGLARQGIDRQSPGEAGDSRPRLLPEAPAMGGIGILLLACAFLGQPCVALSQAPDPYTVLLVRGAGADQDIALVTPELLIRLSELKERSAPAARGVVAVSASYEGKLTGAFAEFKATFQIYCFADRGTLMLPLGGVELKDGTLVDGAAAYPTALPAPQSGYSLPISGQGPHTVSLLFTSRVTEVGEHSDLNFTVPKVAQSRLVVTLPGAAQSPAVLSALGAQHERRGENGQVRVEADLGRESMVHMRWLVSNRSPRPLKMQVREAYLWDLRAAAPSLTAVLNYVPANGAVGHFAIELPTGLDVRSVEVRQAAVPPEGGSPARLKTWRMAGNGNRELRVMLQTPVASPIQVTLGLVAQVAAGPHALLLALPTPRDAQPTEGFLAYQVKNWEVLDKAHYLGVTNLAPATFVQVWVAAGIPEPSLPTRAYTFRRTPGGVSALALVLQEPHPKARQEVSWFIQPGYADVRARTDLASSAKDVMLIEWAVPPALVVADVRGTDVDHWSRAEDRVQVWLKAGKKRTSVELSGWMAYSPNPSQREGLLILPSLSLQSGRFDGARLRVAWSAGMELEPEHLQNLAPLPGKEPGQLSYLAKQPVYRAAFKVRPAPAPLKARALTRIEANGDRLRLIAQMDLQFPQGAPRKVTIRLRNWDGEAGLESPSQAEQRPSPGGPGDRTWTVIVPPGVDRLYSFKLIGTMPLDLSRKLPMPDVSVEGAMPIERWVAVTGRSLYAEDAKGLAQVTNVAGELPWWPAEADAIRRAGTAWKVIEEAWRLSLAPQAPLLAPVQLLSVEQEAALGDGQRWIHQASYLLVGGPADLRLHLPAGARLLGLTLDGKSLPSRQPTPESLWIGLPGTSAPRHLRLRWVYPPRGELFEEPNLGIPRFAALTAPAAVWTVHVPPLYEMTNVDKGHFIAYSGADLELRRAEIMMKLSTWLAERKDVATSTVQAQLAEAQRRFFAHLRRGESLGVLSGSANSHPAETVVKLRGRVQQLKKENARQAREHGFEKTRSDAESQPEPASGDGGERFFALPEQGAPAHGASDASRPPRLRLTPLASQERRLTWIASELLLVFLIGIAILSLFPRVTVWVRQLWPEQLMVAAWIGCEAFGVSPLGVFLFVGGAVFRLAWLAGVLQRRWHHAAATRLTG